MWIDTARLEALIREDLDFCAECQAQAIDGNRPPSDLDWFGGCARGLENALDHLERVKGEAAA